MFVIAAAKADVPWPVLWAPVFSAVAVAVIGFFAGYIALRQWLTARTRVQLDLFEKRKPAFDAVADLLADVTVLGAPKVADLVRFAQGTADAQFLYGPEIAAYVAELQRRASDLVSDERRFIQVPDGLEREALMKSQLAHMEWFREQYRVYEDRFRPYLQIEGHRERLPEFVMAMGKIAAEGVVATLKRSVLP